MTPQYPSPKPSSTIEEDLEDIRAQTTPELWEKLKPLARQKRHEPTTMEDALWRQIRNRRVAGAKFRRQYAIGRFIVDFYCAEARLIIEVDGSIHDYSQEEDRIRQAFLEGLGLQVIRFTNGDVSQHPHAVLERIAEVLASRPPYIESQPTADS
jgi:very-short-patch-repair endonuclease